MTGESADMIIEQDMQDILTVLAVGVFADKRVFSSEIQVFTQSAMQAELPRHDMSALSGAKALLWFEQNKDEVRAKFDGPRSDFDAWLIPILERLAGNVDQEGLLRFLEKIALADEELHVSEKALIALVKRVWGLN